MTARAWVFTGVGEPMTFSAQDTAPPRGAALRVRVLCCTLCQSDLATFTGRRVELVPTVLGHEVVGVIEAFGPTAVRSDALGRPAAVGDRITWAIVAHCGGCFYCRHDLPQKCERGVKYGHHATDPQRPDGGGLADTIVLVPGTEWLRVPESLSTPVAALANCAGATVAAVLDAAGTVHGRTVLIFGAGLLGILAGAWAASGGARVVAVDPDAACRERAMVFGAVHALDPSTVDFEAQVRDAIGVRGADVALELAGRPETVAQGLALVRTGGVVVLAGTVSPMAAVPLDPQQFVRRLLTLRGVHNYQPRHLHSALEFLTTEGGRYPFDTLIAASFPLERVEEAFAAAIQYRGRRVAVVPGGA